MTLQTIPGFGWYLPHPPITPAFPSTTFGNWLQDTGRPKVAWIFQAPKAGTLDKFGFYAGVVSSPSDVKFSFQSFDPATGLPDGSVDQYRVKTGGSFATGWVEPGLMTHDGTDGGTKRTVTKGEVLCCVIEWDSTQSGEIDPHHISNNSSAGQVGRHLPYGAQHNGVSWTKGDDAVYFSVALRYDDGTYARPVGISFPISATVTQNTFNSSSSPDERALYFSLSIPIKTDGGWLALNLGAAAPVDLVLYDTDGTTPLATLTLDPDLQVSPGAMLRYFDFGTEVELLADVFYRFAVKPTTTSDTQTADLTVASVALMHTLPGGSNFHLSTRTDGGAWSETTTKRPWMGLRITAVPDDSGASQLIGGGLVS